MPVDLKIIGDKIQRHRQQLEFTLDAVEQRTGISQIRLAAIEKGEEEPTGDEILIIADLFKCDFRVLVLNEHQSALDSTDILYRKHGAELSADDRRSIQEFIFLCECEAELEELVARSKPMEFIPRYSGKYYKGHAKDVAEQLRHAFAYDDVKIKLDIYSDFRRLGVHIFRRKLFNSNISGLFLVHPRAGKCILVNYSEDVYRQRFSASHEMAHALFDSDQTASVTFWKSDKDLREIRANSFASYYLVPPAFLGRLLENRRWSESLHRDWSEKLCVNGQTLAIALQESKLINDAMYQKLKDIKVPTDVKTDPELPASLTDSSLKRAVELLGHGLTRYYVTLCFDAHAQRLVSAGRLAEMLLIAPSELEEVAHLFGREVLYGD